MKQNTIITIIVILLVGVVSFFGGMKYQQSQRNANFRQFGFGNGQLMKGNGQFGGAMIKSGFRPVAGEIISVDDNSVTIKLPDGSSKIVILSSKTEINTATKGDKSQLKVGEQIAAFGSENSDGSVTAQNIQLNPNLKIMPEQPTQK